MSQLNERMSAARLELIEQQMSSGFCWHSHAKELLAEVHRLRQIEWYWHVNGVSRNVNENSI